VSESQLGRIIAGTEEVLRSDAVTIPPPPRPPTLSSGRCADCLRRGTGRAPRRAPQAESNAYSPLRCSPTRRPANADSAAVDQGQIWPARHPPREAPTRAQKRGMKVAERRWSATAVQPPWCVIGALTRRARRSAPGKGWTLNRSKPACLLRRRGSCRRTVALWRNCDSTLHRTGGGAAAGRLRPPCRSQRGRL
jgi:hypothetical protein